MRCLAPTAIKLIAALLVASNPLPSFAGGGGGGGGGYCAGLCASETSASLSAAKGVLTEVNTYASKIQQELDYVLQLKKYAALLVSLKDLPAWRIAAMVADVHNEVRDVQNMYENLENQIKNVGDYAGRIDDIAKNDAKWARGRPKYVAYEEAIRELRGKTAKTRVDNLKKTAQSNIDCRQAVANLIKIRPEVKSEETAARSSFDAYIATRQKECDAKVHNAELLDKAFQVEQEENKKRAEDAAYKQFVADTEANKRIYREVFYKTGEVQSTASAFEKSIDQLFKYRK